MERLVLRAVEEFLCDTHGEPLWRQVAASARVGDGPLGSDASARPEALIASAAVILEKPIDELFEDLGAWLARREAIRRLLRFSGRDFPDFVLSLEDLPGRAHFVIPDLRMPQIAVERDADGTMRLILPPMAGGWPAILGGLLRAMADDYGALALIELHEDTVSVQIPDESFAEGRDFQLVGGLR